MLTGLQQPKTKNHAAASKDDRWVPIGRQAGCSGDLLGRSAQTRAEQQWLVCTGNRGVVYNRQPEKSGRRTMAV
jgi:hypothetical protein